MNKKRHFLLLGQVTGSETFFSKNTALFDSNTSCNPLEA